VSKALQVRHGSLNLVVGQVFGMFGVCEKSLNGSASYFGFADRTVGGFQMAHFKISFGNVGERITKGYFNTKKFRMLIARFGWWLISQI